MDPHLKKSVAAGAAAILILCALIGVAVGLIAWSVKAGAIFAALMVAGLLIDASIRPMEWVKRLASFPLPSDTPEQAEWKLRIGRDRE